jgi:hypothetical protein
MSAAIPQAGKPADETRDTLSNASANSKPRRMRTNTAEIDSTIIHPGSVKINVKGAFIVDQDSGSPPSTTVNGATYDTKDIRLPFHTAVVSHIAVDVYPASSASLFISLITTTDWRNVSKTCVLLPRTTLSRTWRAPQLYKL